MSHKTETWSFLKLLPHPAPITDQTALRRHFDATSALMASLGGLLASEPGATISLELTAKNGVISYIIAAPEPWEQTVIHYLYAAFPAARIELLDQWSTFDTDGELAGATVQFMSPEGKLRSDEFSGPDPLQPALELLAALPATERLCIQLTLAGAHAKSTLAGKLAADLSTTLKEELKRGLMGSTYKPTDPREKVQEKDDDKTKTAAFRANLRLIALAPTVAAAQGLIRHAATTLHQHTIPGQTKLLYRLEQRRLTPWLTTALRRTHHAKTAFYLTAAEAAHLYHPPLQPRHYPQLDTIASQELPLPENLPETGLLLGYGAFRDARAPIHLAPADRLRHTYLIGQTGTGKSTLFQTAMLQDIEAGEGCCFIDPHGEAIDWLLPRIPAHRAADVVLFDPSDPAGLLGLNLLEWRTPHERDLLIQELILLFYKLFDPTHSGIIGPQFEHWLRNAALTITEPNVRGTLVDIPRLFTDKQFQKSTVARADHWAVKDFWNNQMATTTDFHKSEMLNYFTSKFGGFLGNAVMHQILSQSTSAFDLRTLMDRRKILLVNLSKGRLGSLNAQLLGTLIVTKIQMAALSRADIPADQRPPFYVYIDEFQNVVTDSFASMLSEIRKYGVGLHLAHQYVDQLPESIRQAVTGNIGTLMAFRLGRTDADWLAPHFNPLTPDDLTGIAPYHYYLRTLANGQLTPPFAVQAPFIDPQPQPALAAAVRERVHQYVAATQTPRSHSNI